MFWLSDDITVTRNDDVEINTMKGYLGKVFELIFNLGMAKCFFFGLEVARFEKGIVIMHWKYIIIIIGKYTLVLLKEIGMLGAKPSDIPIDQNNPEHSSVELLNLVWSSIVEKFCW